ncbi:MAG: thioredoxin-disulfide reductase [Bacteroidales bacterium]|nr:thioredoxin-disulfide reductase [Bacteroidales bacterium]
MTHSYHLRSKEIAEIHTCLIIGSGPAGYTAAIYAARANLKPVLYEGMQPGGQLTTTTEVENFPGYPTGVTGTALMNDMRSQAERLGADIRSGYATAVDFSDELKLVEIGGETVIAAKAVIIATGATAKYLGLASEQKFRGMGVSACAVCDGFFYRKQTVAVVGGGDTAAEDATYLAGLAQKVYLIVRKKHLRASKAMQHKVANTPNIEILFEHEVQEVLGDEQGVSGLRLIKEGREVYTINVTGLFLAIGHHPNTKIFADELDLDETGYIITKPGSSHTNCEGVFACGDVQDPVYRQAITAAASGCIAALDVERYLC